MPPVELENVWKFYGDFAAIRNLNLQIEQGECCALLGRNGAGKTTLLRVLGGLSAFDRGRVHILGTAPRSEQARRQIGFLGHAIGVYEDLSAEENLLFFARLAGIREPRNTAGEWLERVDLTRVARMPVRQYSRGMRPPCAGPHVSALASATAP